MKKIILFPLMSVLLLSLGACSSSNTTDGSNNSESATTNSSTTTESTSTVDLNSLALPQLDLTVAADEAQVEMVTSKGTIMLKLFPKLAPKAVENFLTHAKEGYYDGLTFHRVINEFMIQSGDPEGTGAGGESIWGEAFENEISNQLYNVRGALAMANAGADTNGSQFYIVQNTDNVSDGLLYDDYPEAIVEAYKNGGVPSLDGSYTVFGQVISGMETVDAIAEVETDDSDKPTEEVKIEKVNVISEGK
ncbi:peptidylprolyl isomerase [Enterococcus timonensis]|uniref:peptidylprolyl isomerase n=1 Tax=Enterococcus timonensis TaxID=1852364 RepID=UPI0008D9F49F